MKAKIEWTKIFILDSAADHEHPKEERLLGALRNYAWMKRLSMPPHDVKVWLQQNRDIYYITVNEFDPRELDPLHLSEEEQLALQDVGVHHILDRMDKIPSWWETIFDNQKK